MKDPMTQIKVIMTAMGNSADMVCTHPDFIKMDPGTFMVGVSTGIMCMAKDLGWEIPNNSQAIQQIGALVGELTAHLITKKEGLKKHE